MKKILLIMFFFLLPIYTNASSNYDIENYYIDVEVKENGDLFIKELLLVDGSYQMFLKDIFYRDSRFLMQTPHTYTENAIYNGTSLSPIVVKAKPMKKINYETLKEEFPTLKKAYYIEEAKEKEYVEKSLQDGKNLTINYESNYEKIAYLFEYQIVNAVVLHEDVAELYWPFLREQEIDINELEIHIKLPKKSKIMYGFTHGDRFANLKIINQEKLKSVYKKLSKDTKIDIRLVFDRDIISEARKNKETKKIALEEILLLEETKEKEMKEYHLRNEKITYGMEKICIGYLIFFLFWISFIYLKNTKEKGKKSLNNPSLEDYPIAIIELLYKKEITENGFLATILELESKGQIVKKRNYLYLKEKENITISEEILIDLLFEKIGKEKKVSIEAIKNYIKGEKSFKIFSLVYENWQSCVKKEMDKEKFYETNGLPIISSIFLFLIAVFIMFATIYFEVPVFLPLISLLLSIMFFFYSLFMKKRSLKGQAVYIKAEKRKKELQNKAKWEERDILYGLIFHLERKEIEFPLLNLLKEEMKKRK